MNGKNGKTPVFIFEVEEERGAVADRVERCLSGRNRSVQDAICGGRNAEGVPLIQ